MAKGDPQPSPWTTTLQDNAGRTADLTCSFNEGNRRLDDAGITGTRDPQFQWPYLVLGTVDPETGQGEGRYYMDETVSIPASTLETDGFLTIEDVMRSVTCGD